MVCLIKVGKVTCFVASFLEPRLFFMLVSVVWFLISFTSSLNPGCQPPLWSVPPWSTWWRRSWNVNETEWFLIYLQTPHLKTWNNPASGSNLVCHGASKAASLEEDGRICTNIVSVGDTQPSICTIKRMCACGNILLQHFYVFRENRAWKWSHAELIHSTFLLHLSCCCSFALQLLSLVSSVTLTAWDISSTFN